MFVLKVSTMSAMNAMEIRKGEKNKMKEIQCPICEQEYEDYISHVLEKHPVSCEDVISGGSVSKKVEDDEAVALHVASCRSCKEALKREGLKETGGKQ